MPKISVLTAVYIDSDTKLQWFRETLQSVKNQSFSDFEHIIIDDYSPVSLDEIKLTTQDDNRFRWFRAASNQGPAMCRNTAAALAESDAIIILDADDMFGNDITLETMYNIWQEDEKRVVYGNLQQLRLTDGNFVRGRVIVLGEYTFEGSLNLEGLFPVTALHSIECHQAIGGWSLELDAGLEDVEYWIAAGERGFCGHKVNHTTLLYRQHQNSRAQYLRHGRVGDGRSVSRENEMRQKIMDLHKDTFNGDWPMKCCGGNKQASNGTIRPSARVTTLDGFRDDELIWVQYRGAKTASFRVSSKRVKEYRVMGSDHIFQVHRDDIPKSTFESATENIGGVRQRAYLIGVPVPIEVQPEPEITQETLPSREPEMAIIERLDRVAQGTREVEIVEQPLPQVEAKEVPEPELVEVFIQRGGMENQDMESLGRIPKPELNLEQGQFVPIKSEPVFQPEIYDLSSLDLPGSIQTTLVAEGWSLQKLAQAQKSELTPYHGIGPVKAEAIIEMAQRFTGIGSVPDDDLSLLDLPVSIENKLKQEKWTLPELAKQTPAVLESIQGIGLKRAEDIIQRAKRATSGNI